MLKTSPDRFDHSPEAPAGCGFDWSARATVCWPGGRSKETTGESGYWPRCDDDCRRGAHRLEGQVAAVVELGLGLRQHEPGEALCLTALGLALVHPGKNSRF